MFASTGCDNVGYNHGVAATVAQAGAHGASSQPCATFSREQYATRDGYAAFGELAPVPTLGSDLAELAPAMSVFQSYVPTANFAQHQPPDLLSLYYAHDAPPERSLLQRVSLASSFVPVTYTDETG